MNVLKMSKFRLLALLISITMVLAILPASSFATGSGVTGYDWRTSSDASTSTTNITVRVVMPNGTQSVYPNQSIAGGNISAAALGADMGISPDNGMVTPLHAILATASTMGLSVTNESQWDVSVNGNSVYISSFNGAREGDGGTYSGWMYFVNDRYVNLATSNFPLKSNDVVSLFYVNDYRTTVYTYFDVLNGGSEDGYARVVNDEVVKARLMKQSVNFSDLYKRYIPNTAITAFSSGESFNATGDATGRFSFTISSTALSAITAAVSPSASEQVINPYLRIDKYTPSSVDKTALGALIDTAQGLSSSNYTSGTWNDLTTALTAANSVYNSASSTQANVNTAANALANAMDALKRTIDLNLSRLSVTYGLQLIKPDGTPGFDQKVNSYTLATGSLSTLELNAALNDDTEPALRIMLSYGTTNIGMATFPTEIDISNATTVSIIPTIGNGQHKNPYTITLQKSAVNSADSVYAYLPAAGQFVNETNNGGWGSYTNASGTPKMLNAPSGDGVSLGAFGGFTTFKFNTPVANDSRNPYGTDFIVYGNAFSGNAEPGGIMVAQANADGTPGTWYRIAGSEHYEDATIWDYTATYTNPGGTTAADVPWTATWTGGSTTGTILKNTYHNHNWFPLFMNYQQTTLNKNGYTVDSSTKTYSGVKINTKTGLVFGYADVHPNGSGSYDVSVNPYTMTASSTGGDPVDISWAVDANGNPVNLANISFVKVYTGVMMNNGAFGEVSTEVTGLKRVAASSTEAGQTAAPTSLTVGGVAYAVPAHLGTVIATECDENINISVSSGAANVFINRLKSSTATVYNETDGHRLVRVIVQDSTNEPYIFFIDLQGTLY